MSRKILMLVCSMLWMSQAMAFTVNGFTRFGERFDLNARVSGVISLVKVQPGQRVKKGEVLIELNATPQRARLKKAQALEKSLQPETEITQLELEKASELYDSDSLSQVALKNAQNQLAKALGAYHAAQADSALAQYQMQQTRLTSPVDGRVLKIHRSVAEFVNPQVDSRPIISIVNSQQMKAVGMISSKQWQSSLLGRSAKVRFGDKTFEGKISYLGFQRVKQTTGVAAYEIHVNFTTSRLIPEQMPVVIEVAE